MMARLPGLGPRSARRAVLHLIAKREHAADAAGGRDADRRRHRPRMPELRQYRHHEILRYLHRRQTCQRQICVVEDVADLWAMERGACSRGAIMCWAARCRAGSDRPRGLAHSPTDRPDRAEDVTRGHPCPRRHDRRPDHGALHRRPARGRVTLTSLAQGVPIGGELDYLDDGTISAALAARKHL